jgi:hypothetical protein
MRCIGRQPQAGQEHKTDCNLQHGDKVGCWGTLVSSSGTNFLSRLSAEPSVTALETTTKAQRVVHPVIRGAAQTQFLARDETTGQVGLIAVIEPEMAIYV